MKPQLTLEAFADWCEKQPANESYEYFDVCNCAVAQYARHLGINYKPVCASDAPEATFWQRAEWEACPTFDDDPRWGALAARLRAAKATS